VPYRSAGAYPRLDRGPHGASRRGSTHRDRHPVHQHAEFRSGLHCTRSPELNGSSAAGTRPRSNSAGRGRHKSPSPASSGNRHPRCNDSCTAADPLDPRVPAKVRLADIRTESGRSSRCPSSTPRTLVAGSDRRRRKSSQPARSIERAPIARRTLAVAE
jgi:hypothetical protein